MSASAEDRRYAQALTIAHGVLELPDAERAARLDVLCGGDTALRRETEWLIRTAEDIAPDDGLDQRVAEVAGRFAADLRIQSGTPGSYRLLERIGEGGMGAVWLAERRLGSAVQRVALKRLRAGATSQQARFLEEQRILASLNHPNIAHLVDAGDDADGEPFLAMEYVDGERIDRWCGTRGLDLRARIGLFLKVCAAVSHAHERLVIHRDLKPANILVGADGEPKLLDFGIARLIDADATATLATRAMTLAYASPEQVEGAALGTATDVYSLGVVLYELVAGVRPFEHLASDHARSNAIVSGEIAPPSQQLQRVAEAAPHAPAPRAGARRIPADVDAIVLKALRREPVQRYASVREFAEDLQRFLDARPVLARRGEWMYRAQRFVQRNRWPLAAAALFVALASGFTWRTWLAEREARMQAAVSDRVTEFLISTFALSDPTRSGRHDFSAREVLDQGRARVNEELAGQPRVRARLLDALGNAYRGINEGNAGAPLLEEAAQLALDPAVADPLAAARSLRAKARGILAVRGSSDEAEHAAQRALDLVLAHADGATPLLADAYGTLAQALDAAGKGPQAMTAARQALAMREATHDSPLAIAQSLLDICGVTSSSGKQAEALPFCERALSLYAGAGATRTNDYRLALRQYENVLFYRGDYIMGMATNRERVALTRELFGPDSAAFAMDLVTSAETLAERGLFDEAAAALDEGTPVILRRNGAQSTQYALAMFNAGWLKYLLGEFDAAVLSLRKALTLYEAAVGGKDNDRLPVLRVDLAMALIESGRADAEARTLLEAVVAARSTPHEDAVGLAYARLPLARWHVAHQQYPEAESLLDQVEAVGGRIESEMHARAAATRAAIQRARGNAADALRFEQTAYELTLHDVGAQHPRTARYALAYANALRAAGEHDRAEALQREFGERLERAYPADSAFRRLLPVRR
ncbi:serine/threonine-protein kinase [Dokdonella sp.]|uniref:serine/threonine-protein kinase n=1 Tax=Dokdonella sp. TaxID=2291710 RepID=UPI001B2E9E70|nr:serine/threonine-protein kinase [Dokdonella sp.]MBO9664173.1 protein kinase [Dokdonella sp.]